MNISDELKEMYLNNNLGYLHALRKARFITVIGSIAATILSLTVLFFAPMLGVSQDSTRLVFLLMILLTFMLCYVLFRITSFHNPHNEGLIRLNIDPRITLTREMIARNLKELARLVVVAERAFLGVKSYKHRTEADLERFDKGIILAKQDFEKYIKVMEKFGLPVNRQSVFDSLDG